MSRKVILIGGKFHRKSLTIDDHQHTIRVPVSMDQSAKTKLELEDFQELKYEEYAQVASIFGYHGIIPDHVFIHTSMSPVEFIRNLVLDYTR